MDSRLFVLLLCLGNLIIFVMLFTFVESNSHEDLLRQFMYGKLLQSIGMSAALLRGIAPEAVTVAAANGVYFVGVALESYCLIYVGRTPSGKVVRIWKLAAAGLVISFSALYVTGADTGTRTFINALIVTLYSLSIAAGLLLYNNGTRLRRILGLFFLALSIPQLLRGLEAWAHHADYTIYSVTPIQIAAFVTSYAHILISSLAYLLMSREIADIKLKLAAATDYLTGINNRRQFMHLAGRSLMLTAHQKLPATVIMIDLDHFKQVNDTYGHAVGDDVLVHFSQETASVLRNDHILARYGGEEFIIFAPNVDTKQALQLGHCIQAGIAASVAANPAIPPYTASMGIVTMPAADTNLDDLISEADAALLRAKHSGRNRIVQIPPLREINDGLPQKAGS